MAIRFTILDVKSGLLLSRNHSQFPKIGTPKAYIQEAVPGSTLAAMMGSLPLV